MCMECSLHLKDYRVSNTVEINSDVGRLECVSNVDCTKGLLLAVEWKSIANRNVWIVYGMQITSKEYC